MGHRPEPKPKKPRPFLANRVGRAGSRVQRLKKIGFLWLGSVEIGLGSWPTEPTEPGFRKKKKKNSGPKQQPKPNPSKPPYKFSHSPLTLKLSRQPPSSNPSRRSPPPILHFSLLLEPPLLLLGGTSHHHHFSSTDLKIHHHFSSSHHHHFSSPRTTTTTSLATATSLSSTWRKIRSRHHHHFSSTNGRITVTIASSLFTILVLSCLCHTMDACKKKIVMKMKNIAPDLTLC